MADKKSLPQTANIESRIMLIRGHCERVELKAPGTRRRPPCGEKVMLDADLAELYGVETGALNRAVKRNSERFPKDFMFQLTAAEYEDLRCQIGISNNSAGRGGRRYLPYVFSEHGALMLGNVLKSERAVEVSIHVVRAFVHLRELIAGNKELAQKLAQLDRKVGAHDKAIAEIISALRQLMVPEGSKKKRPIGFVPWEEK